MINKPDGLNERIDFGKPIIELAKATGYKPEKISTFPPQIAFDELSKKYQKKHKENTNAD